MKSPNRNIVRKIIAPGIWIDEDGHSHWSLPDLLAHVELEDTSENRLKVAAMLEDLIVKQNPEAQIVKRSSPEE